MLKLFILCTLYYWLCSRWCYYYSCGGALKNKPFSHKVITSFSFPLYKECGYISRINQAAKWRNKEREQKQRKTKVKVQSPDHDVGAGISRIHQTKKNIYTKINEEIKNIGKLIVEDDQYDVPKSCLLEINKIYKDFEFQTSIILFLENYMKKGNKDIRKIVGDYIKAKCSGFIEDFFLSDNGILNIKIKDEFLIDELEKFYKRYVFCSDAIIRENKNVKKTNGTDKNTVLVDFCSVNMGKYMHLGHLKSLFLGNAISNVFKFLNCSVRKRNHIGDWNVNLAIIITFLIIFWDHFSMNFFDDLISYHNNDTKINERISTMTETAETVINENECENKKNQYDIQKKQKDTLAYCSKVLMNLKEQTFYEKCQNIDISKYEYLDLSAIEVIYTLAKQLYATSDIFVNYTQIILKKMYQKDTKVIGVWDTICNRTKRENAEIYKSFGIKKLIDKGESFYIKYVPLILKRMKEENAIIEIDKKWCVLLKKRNVTIGYSIMSVINNKTQYYDVVRINEEIVERVKKKDISYLKTHFDLLNLKNETNYTYAAIDLATLYYRVHFEKANKIIYVVDENQKKHFMLVFSIANILQLIPYNNECICITYGYVLNEANKKIKTKEISKNVRVKDILKKCRSLNTPVSYGVKEELKTKTNWKRYVLSSIVYSYISVKNWKRQTMNTILRNIHKEYIYILTSYNDISKFLGKWANYSFFDFFKKCFDFSIFFYKIYPDLKHILLQILKFDFIILEVAEHYSIEKLCAYLLYLSKKVQELFQKAYIQTHIRKVLNGIKRKDIDAFSERLNYIKKNEKNVNENNCNVCNCYIGNCRKIDEQIKKLQLCFNLIDDSTDVPIAVKKKECAKENSHNGNRICSEDKVLTEKWKKVQLHLVNIITVVMLLQSYLFTVSKTFHILNIDLIKFRK